MAAIVDQPARRLAAFTVALAVAFVAAFGVGRLVGDDGAGSPAHDVHAEAER